MEAHGTHAILTIDDRTACVLVCIDRAHTQVPLTPLRATSSPVLTVILDKEVKGQRIVYLIRK